ncbi:MAG: hypothetical protein JRI23_10770 [Deltaproteobacteria bacterium]|jgi:anti-sigma factor RsiW|nr:hypothetical protein [Deltaproteobacteria bacterium]MBW2532160.1 hypothetical protein [Deltaproteobacteria bacterium]
MSASKPMMPPVTDEELMRLFDDELGDERRAEVESYLAEDQDARDKLVGMDWVGDLLREQLADDERADGIADAVMASIDAPAEAPQEAEQSEDEVAEVIPLPSRRREEPAPLDQPRAANDNAKSIFALAAAAAAVAAGLYFWSRGGADDADLARLRAFPPSAVASHESVPSGEAVQPKWPHPAPVEEPAEEPSAAVEVASVDFGSHTGSVFYVSTGPEDEATTTAVVWVTDDVTGDVP